MFRKLTVNRFTDYPHRKRRWQVSVLILVWAAVTVAVAVEQTEKSTNVLTLTQALILADQNRFDLAAVRAERDVAQGQITEARSAALPQLNARAQYTRLDDVAAFSMGDLTFEMGQKDNYEAALEVQQLLYAGGGVQAALRMARNYDRAVVYQIEYSRMEVAYSVHAQFNRVLLAREQLVVTEEAVKLAARNLQDVKALFDQGVSRRFDVLRAEEQLSRNESGRIAARNALQIARLSLLKGLELPLDESRVVEGALVYEPVHLVLSNAVTVALSQRQDLARANLKVAVQHEQVTVARSEGRPSVGLFGEVKYANPDRQAADEWESSWLAGVRCEMPIFDGLRVRGRVRQQRSALRQAEYQRDNLVSAIQLEVAQALADMETAVEQVEAVNRRVLEAEEAFRLARRSYEEGLAQQLDVLDAQVAYTDSRRAYAAAVFQHVMAYRLLQRATGTLEPGE